VLAGERRTLNGQAQVYLCCVGKTGNVVSPTHRQPYRASSGGRQTARSAVGGAGKRMRRKRTASCNGLHRGSNFALTRKGADFRVVQLSQARVRDSIEGSMRETGKRRFSVLVPVTEWINDAMFAKGFWSLTRPALARQLNAVREPCAVKVARRVLRGGVPEKECGHPLSFR
jgi:hypothetical protein